MDLRTETIHYRQPMEILRSLGKEARQQLDADEERLIAWRWAQDVVVPKLEAMLVELEAQVERAGERLAKAEEVLTAAELAIREAQHRLERAQERSGEALGGSMQGQGGVNARFPPLGESQLAESELEGGEALREMQHAVTNRGTAQRKLEEAEHRMKDCQRLLAHFHELRRPETPTLDLLWALMDGEREGRGTGQ
jgi:hypothetical protein